MTAVDVVGWVAVCVGMVVVNQSVWIVWGLLAMDPGTIMTASTVCGLASFNLLWYGLRRAGLRAFFPHETPIPPPALANVAP